MSETEKGTVPAEEVEPDEFVADAEFEDLAEVATTDEDNAVEGENEGETVLTATEIEADANAAAAKAETKAGGKKK